MADPLAIETGAAAPRLFRYRAVETATGRRRSGERSGVDAFQVRSALRSIGLQVEFMQEVGAARPPALLSPLVGAWQARQRRQRRSERADLCDALATMIGAGLPLEQALGSLAASPLRGATQRRMLQALRNQLVAGEALAEAARDQPAWFDAVDLAMLRAGQQAGDLAPVLRAISEHHQRGSAITQRLIAALAYPAFLLLLALGVVVFLSSQTLPQLVTLVQSAGRPVPALTTAVVGVGQAIAQGWWLILLVGVALLAALPSLLTLAVGRLPILARVLAANPVARARRRGRVAHLAFTLARLQRCGLPLTDALEAATEVADSGELRRLLETATAAIRRGEGVATALAAGGLVDGEFAQLLHLGEASGELPLMLERIAERAERSAGRNLERLALLVEPVAIVILAVLIGIVVFAAVTPLVQMGTLR